MNFWNRLSPQRQGEILVILEAVLWGLFPVLSTLSFNSVGPLFSCGLSLLASLCYFVPTVCYERRWHEFQNREAWKPILGAVLILGIGFYFLSFLGTALSTPNNVSILLLLEVFTSSVFFHFWKKERMGRLEIIGTMLIVGGALLVLFQKDLSPNSGDLLIALAVLIAPLGNDCSKKARALVSTGVIMTARNGIAAVVILSLAAAFEPFPDKAQLADSGPKILLNGFLILGLSKVFWIEGIHRLPIAKAISLNSIFPVVTLWASYVFLNTSPNAWQLAAVVPAILGTVLLSRPAGPKVAPILYAAENKKKPATEFPPPQA